MRRLADRVEAMDPRGFSMTRWWVRYGEQVPVSCRTVACLAGHAVEQAVEEGFYRENEVFLMRDGDREYPREDEYGLYVIKDMAARYLGLTPAGADRLFLPEYKGGTAAQAARVLRRVLIARRVTSTCWSSVVGPTATPVDQEDLA
jgi:hypothetical protein